MNHGHPMTDKLSPLGHALRWSNKPLGGQRSFKCALSGHMVNCADGYFVSSNGKYAIHGQYAV